MRRKTTITLLALGAVLGYAHGFSSLRCHAKARRDDFQRHVASLCVNAARQAERPAPRVAAPGPPEALQADTGEGR